MTNVDEAHLLDQLMEAQERMRVAMGAISAIAVTCHPGVRSYSTAMAECKYQQTRGNALEVEVEKLNARIAKLQAVADIAKMIFHHGDLAWDPVGARGARRVGLLCALRALGES